MAKCDDTTKNVRYVLAERLVSKEADTKLSNGKVKFFSVSTKDGKIVDDDVTATVTVKDDAISSYYNNEKSNSEELVLEVRKPPNLWQITGQYNGLSNLYQRTLNSWCYANAKNPHGIIYNALGQNYTSGAKNAAGTYNTDGIAYLNVSCVQ